MYVFFIALMLFIALCVGSLLITYFFTVLHQQSGRHPEPTISNLILVQITLLLSAIFDAVGDIISLVTSKTFGVTSNLFSNSKTVLQMIVAVFIFSEITNNTDILLRTGDTSWRCLIQPLFQNVLLAIGQVVRLVYDSVAPLYNYNYLVFAQATRGSIAVAVKCDLQTVVATVKLLIETFVAVFESLFTWSGVGEMSTENNIFRNEFNITTVLMKSQEVVSHQEEIFSCVCEGMEEVVGIGFAVVRQKELPMALNHLFNIPVSLLQTVAQLLPLFGPRLPYLTDTIYHFRGFFYYTGKYFDKVTEDMMRRIIRLFIDDFNFQGLPKEFLFTTFAHSFQVPLHIFHTIWRSCLHIAFPIPKYITNIDYMMKTMRFDQAAKEFDLFLYGLANNAYWFLEIADLYSKSLVRSAVTGGEVKIVGLPEAVKLECLPSKKWTVAAACIPYLSATIFPNLLYIGTNLVSEFLWKSLFTQEQSVLRLLQRYDGPSFPRNKEITCEYRKSIDWDLTAGKCMCDIPDGFAKATFTDEEPWGVSNYDPFCGQPNLNANVFGNLDRISNFIKSSGKLGDKLQELQQVQQQLYLELFRVSIKAVLNIPDILQGKFFKYKTNCGYGVPEHKLEMLWEEKGNSIIDCRPAKAGFMRIRGRCVPIHDHIRYEMCETEANDRGLIPVCDKENKEGCSCNIGLPLNETSKCSCIYFFPDAPQEVAQTAFRNQIIDLHYNHTSHWCQTYLFEWGLYYMDRASYVVDKFFQELHPAYDSQGQGYCEATAYPLLETSILHYSQSQFNEQKELYDAVSLTYSAKACKLYGSYDFVCSTSMTVRSGIRLITYQFREISMTLFEMLGGSLDGVTVNFGNRLCDLQRLAASVSSTVASTVTVGSANKNLRSGIAKVIFSLLDGPIEVLNMVNHAVQFLMSIITGEMSISGQEPVFNFLRAEITIVFNYIRTVIEGFENVFESISRGAGGFFRTLDTIVGVFQGLLSDVAMEMVALVTKVFASLLEMFSGGPVYSDFFNDLWRLIAKGTSVLLQQSGRVLEEVLKLLGPIGQFIRDISGEICNSLQGVLCTLTAGSFCDMGCVGFEAASFSAPPVVKDIGNVASKVGDFFDGLFHRRLHSSLHNLPKILAEELEWSGTSECDMYVHAYQDFNFTDLRPFEKVQLLQCVEQRAMAVQMGKQTGLNIPHDIVYNYKRKYVLLYQAFKTGTIYSRYSIGELDTQTMVKEMKESGADVNLFLPMWNKVRLSLLSLTSFSHIDSFIHNVFHDFDDSIKTSESGWGNVYRIYSHTSRAVKDIYNKTRDIDIKYQIQQVGKVAGNVTVTLPQIPHHIQNSFKHFKTATIKTSKTRSKMKLKSRKFILKAAGLNADITPCDQQAKTKICTNCVVVDNFFNTVINEGLRMKSYYEYTFIPVVIPGFVEYWEDEDRETRAKAWRTDMAKLMDEAATAAAEDVGNWTEEQVEAINKGYKLQSRRHKLYSNATSPLTNWERASEDWRVLFVDWKIRNDKKFIDILTDFISVSNEDYIPFTAYSASWWITYPFAATCPMEKIYCTYEGHDTTTKRLDKIENSFTYMWYLFLALLVVDWLFGLPVVGIVAPYWLYIMATIFMIVVYDYTWGCFPNIPNCLADDIFSFANDRVFPNCFCSYFPALAETCNLDNCFLCSVQTSYKTCPENIPDLKELGVFWAPLIFVRTTFPTALEFVYNTMPFIWFTRRIDALDPIFQQTIYRTPLTQIEKDCYAIHRGDIIIIIAVLYGSSVALQFAVPILIRGMQHGFKMFLILLALFYNMAVSIELSTVVGVGKNTYQDDGY